MKKLKTELERIRKIEAVLERHRIKTGANLLSVNFEKDVDPDALEKSLDKVHNNVKNYNALSEKVKLEAHIAYLKDRLRKIREICKMDILQLSAESAEFSKFRSKIWHEAEIFGVDIQFALDYYKKQYGDGDEKVARIDPLHDDLNFDIRGEHFTESGDT